jgi:hypothetical protein
MHVCRTAKRHFPIVLLIRDNNNNETTQTQTQNSNTPADWAVASLPTYVRACSLFAKCMQVQLQACSQLMVP